MQAVGRALVRSEIGLATVGHDDLSSGDQCVPIQPVPGTPAASVTVTAERCDIPNAEAAEASPAVERTGREGHSSRPVPR